MKYLVTIIFLMVLKSSLAQSVDGALKTITASGSAGTYTISEGFPANYDSKERFIIQFPDSYTGSSATLNRFSLGAKSIKNSDGTSAVTLTSGARYILSYNGTYYQIVGGSGGGGSSGLTVGSTTVSSGTNGYVLFNNSGVLGNTNTPTLTGTNITGLPVSTGISGLGTGVATALGVNTGSAGAFVVNGGALGTPSSGTLTNATGLPLTTGVTGTLGATNGGTGQSSYTTGDLLYASSSSALSKLAASTSGYVLTSNGAGMAPSYQAVTPTGAWLLGSGGAITAQNNLTYSGANLFSLRLTGEPVLGYNAATSSGTIGTDWISIGNLANSGTYKIGTSSIAIGSTAKTKENYSISIGADAGNTSGSDGGASVSLGLSANAGSSNIGDYGIAIGGLSKSIGVATIGIGNEAHGKWGGDIAIGYRAMKSATLSNGGNVVIGYNAGQFSPSMLGSNVVIGFEAQANNENTVVIGNGAGHTSGTHGEGHITIGSTADFGTSNIGEDGITIGNGAKAQNFASIGLGYLADVQEDYAMSISQIDNLYFQTGWGKAPGTGGSGIRMQAGFPVGSNLSANERVFRIAAARATGTGISGNVLFEYSPPVASGSTTQTLSTALTMDGPTGSFNFSRRISSNQGADVASVAGAIALGGDGNTFEITGTNAITLISNLNWQNGSQVTLLFTSTATLTDGTANSGTDIGMELAGNANFVASADDVITLVLSEIGGTQRWREVSRSVN